MALPDSQAAELTADGDRSASKTGRAKTARYYRMREQVVQVAVELFSRNGYASTGVADLGEAAGLARGALYYYIGSKDALLAEIHDRVLDPLLKEAAVIATVDAGFHTRLRLISESLLWQIVNRPDYIWVFLHEQGQLQAEHRDISREKWQRFETYIRDMLAEGQRTGEVRFEDLELTTLAFLNLHNHTYQWLGNREIPGVEDLSTFYCGVFLNGILTDGVAGDPDPAGLTQGRLMLEKLRDIPPAP